MMTRRTVVGGAGLAAGLGAAGCAGGPGPAAATPAKAADAKPALAPITGAAQPITREERLARIAKAQELMGEAGMGALLIEPGAAMTYFSGLQWGRSERLTALVIPARGEIAVVTPAFEEPSVRETLLVGQDVRVWQEHESPFVRVAQILKDRKVAAKPLAVEGSVRAFVLDWMAAAAPGLEIVSGEPITRGCRMIKTEAEQALMQTAADVTMAAYRHVYPRVEAGMSQHDIAAMMREAMAALGGASPWALVLLGEAAAYPHGTRKPQKVTEGEVVLMDCGCAVHGYQSDISRSWVHGAPSARQRKVWDTVKRGQEIVLETARPGVPAGAVDDAVRAYYEKEGWGPGYALPGLSHRTGHGIGMEGHEPINFVRGEATELAPGMCFSDEPGLYIPGELGVRLEDCLVITEAAPRLFSGFAPSLDDPIG